MWRVCNYPWRNGGWNGTYTNGAFAAAISWQPCEGSTVAKPYSAYRKIESLSRAAVQWKSPSPIEYSPRIFHNFQNPSNRHMLELVSPDFSKTWLPQVRARTSFEPYVISCTTSWHSVRRTINFPQHVASYSAFKGQISSPYKITPNALH